MPGFTNRDAPFGGGNDSTYSECALLLARLGSAGAVEATAADDLDLSGWAHDLTMTAQNGKIVLVGDDGYDVAIAMFDASTLELDSSFGDDGIVIDSFFANYSDEAFNVSIQQDGKVVLTATNGSVVYVARYTAAGADDTTFNNVSDNLPLNVGWGLPHHWSAAFVIASGKHMRRVGWGLPHHIPQPQRSGLIVPLDQRYFAQHDANFNITSITDANGQVAERYLYTAYGEVEYRGGSWETLQGGTTQLGWTYLFQGRPLDGSSGKYDFRNRPYDAPTGRFTSADPLGYPDGASRYQAFGSNPAGFVDPWGLCTEKSSSTSARKQPEGPIWVDRSGEMPQRTMYVTLTPAQMERAGIKSSYAARYARYGKYIPSTAAQLKDQGLDPQRTRWANVKIGGDSYTYYSDGSKSVFSSARIAWAESFARQLWGGLLYSDERWPVPFGIEYFNNSQAIQAYYEECGFMVVASMVALDVSGMAAGMAQMASSNLSPRPQGVQTIYSARSPNLPQPTAFDDFVSNPASLYGRTPEEVATILGPGWTKGHYGITGQGWKFTKGDLTVFYHEGGRHGGPYYGLSSGKTGRIKVVGKGYKPLPGDKAKIIPAPGE